MRIYLWKKIYKNADNIITLTEETKINISIANQNRFDEDYYANKGVRRSDFKIACKVRGWSINDFEQIKSGEKCNDGKNKYFYVRKFSIKKLEKI